MKRGSEYAKRIKRLFGQWTRRYGKVADDELTDPLDQCVVAILSACTTNNKASGVFRKLRQQVVDLNELRVTPAVELAEMIGEGIPLAELKAQRIVDTLNDVRRRQDRLDLSFLRDRTRREAREYLESLAGMDRAAAANVVLYSLGGHAIPVDDLTLYVLRKDEAVEPTAEAADVQGFLERHINASDTRTFVELLARHVTIAGARVPVEKLDELLNPPPPPPEPEPAAAPANQSNAQSTETPKPAKGSGAGKRTHGKKSSSTEGAGRRKSEKSSPGKKKVTKRPAKPSRRTAKAKRR